MADEIKQILIVEDDDATRYLCEAVLLKEGYQVTLAATVAEAQTALSDTRFSLVALDLNLPDGKGMDLIQSVSSVPFLIMTISCNPQERFRGFEAGAGDYLVKPFHPGELIHRVNNLLLNHTKAVRDCLQFGEWILNMADLTLVKADDAVELTRGEFDLLAALVGAKGRVLSRDFLLDVISGKTGDGHPRTVDVLISRLRKKVESNPHQPRYILTVSGIGYRMAAVSQ